jgi:hypothetical protein
MVRNRWKTCKNNGQRILCVLRAATVSTEGRLGRRPSLNGQTQASRSMKI